MTDIPHEPILRGVFENGCEAGRRLERIQMINLIRLQADAIEASPFLEIDPSTPKPKKKPTPYGGKSNSTRARTFLDPDNEPRETCVACAGTGVYDNYDSPPCGACDGEGSVAVEREDELAGLLDAAEDRGVCRVIHWLRQEELRLKRTGQRVKLALVRRLADRLELGEHKT